MGDGTLHSAMRIGYTIQSIQIRTRPNCTRYGPIETIAALDDLQSLAYSQNCSRPTYSLIKVSNNRNLYGLREL